MLASFNARDGQNLVDFYDQNAWCSKSLLQTFGTKEVVSMAVAMALDVASSCKDR